VGEAKSERLNLMLESTTESVNEIEAAAEKLAAEAGLDEDERFHVSMAAREAAVTPFCTATSTTLQAGCRQL